MAADSEDRALELDPMDTSGVGSCAWLFRSLPLGLVVQDTNGAITAANAAAEEILGLSVGELRGLTSDDPRWRPITTDGSPFPGRHHPAMVALRTGVPVDNVVFGVHNPRRDAAVWLNVSARPIHDATGTLVAVYTVFEDVTARRAAEDEVHRLSQVVAQSPASILITDLDGRIVFANAAFTEQTGYPLAEVRGLRSTFLRSPQTPARQYQELWATIPTGAVWRGELVFRCRDGTEKLMWAHVTPIRGPDGRITCYAAVHEDITERRRVESELDAYRHRLEDMLSERTQDLVRANAELVRSRDAADAASRAKTAFLANVSHELRTPLNAIKGMTHLLRRTPLDERQTDRLDKIERAGQQLLATVESILELARLEADGIQFDVEPVDVARIIADVADLISDSAAAKGLQVEREITALPAGLIGDGGRLRQALLKCAQNAVRFTSEGSVRLRATCVQDGSDGCLVRFDVIDTGPGMSAEVAARVFAPFEQGDNSMSRAFGGLGVGLAITRRIAAAMGGEVGVESELGRGSHFWFTARLERASAAADEGFGPGASAAEEALSDAFAGRRILLVEDDPMNREVVVDLVGLVGLVVDSAEDGVEALELARRNRYDLVLMDVQMPRMDGLEATRQLRQMPGWADVPIVALTANVFGENRTRCARAGMNAFVGKPVAPEQLFDVLLEQLTARKPLPA